MTTLKEEYRIALKLQDNLGALKVRQDSDEFQNELDKVVDQFKTCDRIVYQLSLFSENETMDDLVTNDVQYLDIPYRLACVKERVRRDNISRKETLEATVDHYLEFLRKLDSYGILTNQLKRKLKDVTSNNNDLQYLTSKDATTRRQDKIDNFKLERALEEKLKQSTSLTDEDELRKLKIADLGLKALKTFNSLETISMELELVRNEPEIKKQIKDERERERDGKGNSGYRAGVVDELPDSKPLLDKHGKVNRPFTIVSSRDQVKKQVFGTGQTLPTMTVDEYLDQEMKMGNVIQGGEQSAKQESEDEDDEEKNDRETYKAREWDEFTEANPKGWGNTMNKG